MRFDGPSSGGSGQSWKLIAHADCPFRLGFGWYCTVLYYTVHFISYLTILPHSIRNQLLVTVDEDLEGGLTNRSSQSFNGHSTCHPIEKCNDFYVSSFYNTSPRSQVRDLMMVFAFFLVAFSASLVCCSLLGFGCNGVSGNGPWRCQPCRSYSGKTWSAPTRTFPAMLSQQPGHPGIWCSPGRSTGQYRVLCPCSAFGQVISSDGETHLVVQRTSTVQVQYMHDMATLRGI